MISETIQIGYILTSVVAGILTVLAPCVLPILPLIISGSAGSRSLARPLRIIAALAVSVIAVSLLLQFSATLLGLPTMFWRIFSGGILITFGIFTFWPNLWEKCVTWLGFKKSSEKLLSKGTGKGGAVGDILVGISLGPIFSSCSPTYLTIVGIIIPQTNWLVGVAYLLFYVAGLSAVLLLVAIFGRKFVSKIKALNNPKGVFKRVLAIFFVVIGVLIIFGWDKQIEAYLLEQGLYGWSDRINNILPKPLE